MSDEICYLDAAEMATRVRAKTLSPVELVHAHLDRIARVNPKLNAVVTVMENALDAARDAEAAVMRGDRLGPLHGVPFTIKDCLDTAGVRTTRGSRLFADHVPRADATVVARLRQAGAIPIGKTNLPEFALWWETGNLVFGRTANPWNIDRTSGGSSGGEAAAIAAGLSPLGIGSDVGGSIRAPAHYCGIVGFKATHGRVPVTGHFPETLLRFMHVGPMARTVRDVSIGLGVMSGPDGRDWYAVPVAPPEIPDASRPLPRLRVGWIAERAFGPVHREVVATVARAAAILGGLGCEVEPVRIPALTDRDWNALTLTLFGAAGAPYFAQVIGDRHGELHPALRKRLSAQVKSLANYVAVEDEVEDLRRQLSDFFGRSDLLLCPTVPIPAPPHESAEYVIEGETVPPRHVLRGTVPFDVSGSPALSVPFGWSSEGLPIGVQLVGRHFDETTVLRAGMALEAAFRSESRRPPV